MSADISSTLPTPTVDPYKHLQIVLNPDGSITRNPNRYPNTAAAPCHPVPVLSKDVPISQSNKTWARIFLPRFALELERSSSAGRLPLLVYFHAGGFINCSAASTIFHVFCSNIAIELKSIVVSVDYRLAPEHRLPAAYDDATDALHWINTGREEWLQEHADFDHCYVMGSSSGANIVYHASLRAAAEADGLGPLKIKGLILHQPFIGGTQQVESELRRVNDPVLPPGLGDFMWGLALPIGADLNHEYCNPLVCGGSKHLEKVKQLGWSVLVTGCDGDPLVDRQVALANMMKEKGVDVVIHFRAGDHHGIDISQPEKAKLLHLVLKEFMLSTSGSYFSHTN